MRMKTKALAALIPLLLLGGTANSQTPPVDCIQAETCGDPVTVPEPGTLLLFATGIASLALARKRKKR